MTRLGNFAGRVEALAANRGWLPRLAYVAGEERVTFGEVFEGAGRAAAHFQRKGIRRGDRIIVALPDGIDFVWAFLGALRVGAVAVLINSLMHPDEIRRAGKLAEATAAVAGSELAGLFDITAISPDDLREETGPPPPVAVCDGASIGFAAFTSGTTGEPKLCFHTHGDPDVFHQAVGSAVRITPADVSYSVSRMYFSYGLGNSIFLPLLGGGTTVLTAQRATEDAALSTIRRHGITVFYGQPSFFARMLAHPDHQALGTLRSAVVGGELLAPSLEARLRVILGDRLLNLMGTTEIGHAFLANGPDDVRESTLGRVLPPYLVRIVDGDGVEVPAGVEGSLQVSGPTIGPGVGRGDDQPRRLRDDEWYTTGDAATIDRDGYVTLHGRLDDIEIVGGTNVHPGEIEDLFASHPDVREVAVCAVSHDGGPSALHAFVVAGQPSQRVRDELHVLARTSLTWYKVPEYVNFVDELPRNPTGKLLRRKLRTFAERATRS